MKTTKNSHNQSKRSKQSPVLNNNTIQKPHKTPKINYTFKQDKLQEKLQSNTPTINNPEDTKKKHTTFTLYTPINENPTSQENTPKIKVTYQLHYTTTTSVKKKVKFLNNPKQLPTTNKPNNNYCSVFRNPTKQTSDFIQYTFKKNKFETKKNISYSDKYISENPENQNTIKLPSSTNYQFYKTREKYNNNLFSIYTIKKNNSEKILNNNLPSKPILIKNQIPPKTIRIKFSENPNKQIPLDEKLINPSNPLSQPNQAQESSENPNYYSDFLNNDNKINDDQNTYLNNPNPFDFNPEDFDIENIGLDNLLTENFDSITNSLFDEF